MELICIDALISRTAAPCEGGLVNVEACKAADLVVIKLLRIALGNTQFLLTS